MDDRSGKAGGGRGGGGGGGGGEDERRVYEASPAQQQPPQYHHHHQYGTFQGVAYYTQPPPQPQAAVGIPQPAPPPAVPPYLYPHGYHTVPGYAVAEGTPIRLPRLPCCGLGMGWFMFIAGFFLAFIPWYVGALVLLCGRVDYREKPGLVACTIAAILATIAITFGVSEDPHPW